MTGNIDLTQRINVSLIPEDQKFVGKDINEAILNKQRFFNKNADRLQESSPSYAPYCLLSYGDTSTVQMYMRKVNSNGYDAYEWVNIDPLLVGPPGSDGQNAIPNISVSETVPLPAGANAIVSATETEDGGLNLTFGIPTTGDHNISPDIRLISSDGSIDIGTTVITNPGCSVVEFDLTTAERELSWDKVSGDVLDNPELNAKFDAKEDIANKIQDLSVEISDNDKYPSASAVKQFVTATADTKLDIPAEITPGNYARVMVDNHGLVTSGEETISSDLVTYNRPHDTNIDIDAGVSLPGGVDGGQFTVQDYLSGITANLKYLLSNPFAKYINWNQLTGDPMASGDLANLLNDKEDSDNKVTDITVDNAGSVDHYPSNQAITQWTESRLNTKLDKNPNINPGTFTKVIVDENGLITNGDRVTADEISYTIDNTPNPLSTLPNNYGSVEEILQSIYNNIEYLLSDPFSKVINWGAINGNITNQQDLVDLLNTKQDKSNISTVLLSGSADDTRYPSNKAVVDYVDSGLNNKADKSTMTPGTYTRVVVNGDGIVTSGDQIASTDIAVSILEQNGSDADAIAATNIQEALQNLRNNIKYLLDNSLKPTDPIFQEIQSKIDDKATKMNLATDPSIKYTKLGVNSDGIVTSVGNATAEDFTVRVEDLAPSDLAPNAEISNLSLVVNKLRQNILYLLNDPKFGGLDTRVQMLEKDKLTANPAIVAGTGTRVTWDEKGLVTGGGNATLTDFTVTTYDGNPENTIQFGNVDENAQDVVQHIRNNLEYLMDTTTQNTNDISSIKQREIEDRTYVDLELAKKIDKRSSTITPGTGTKITYDENGLILSSDTATANDIPVTFVEPTPSNALPTGTIKVDEALQSVVNNIKQIQTDSVGNIKSVSWGDIQGDLINQTDLDEKFNTKEDSKYKIQVLTDDNLTSPNHYPSNAAITQWTKNRLLDKLDKNVTPITPGTFTKITVDEKGLVTNGATIRGDEININIAHDAPEDTITFDGDKDIQYAVQHIRNNLEYLLSDPYHATWGDIRGNISLQNDLQAEFNTKEDAANKVTAISNANRDSQTVFPTVSATVAYVDGGLDRKIDKGFVQNLVTNLTIENVNNNVGQVNIVENYVNTNDGSVTNKSTTLKSDDINLYVEDPTTIKLSLSKNQVTYDSFQDYDITIPQPSTIGWTNTPGIAYNETDAKVTVGNTNNHLVVSSKDRPTITLTDKVEEVAYVTDIDAVSDAARAHVDQRIEDLKENVIKVVGWISNNDPRDYNINLSNGDLWFTNTASDASAIINTVRVSKWDTAIAEADKWVSVDYTPSTLDMWINLNSNRDYYWYNNSWRINNYNLEMDNNTVEIFEGRLRIKPRDSGVITNDLSKFSDNEVIDYPTFYNKVTSKVNAIVDNLAIKSNTSDVNDDLNTKIDKDITEWFVSGLDAKNDDATPEVIRITKSLVNPAGIVDELVLNLVSTDDALNMVVVPSKVDPISNDVIEENLNITVLPNFNIRLSEDQESRVIVPADADIPLLNVLQNIRDNIKWMFNKNNLSVNWGNISGDITQQTDLQNLINNTQTQITGMGTTKQDKSPIDGKYYALKDGTLEDISTTIINTAKISYNTVGKELTLGDTSDTVRLNNPKKIENGLDSEIMSIKNQIDLLKSGIGMISTQVDGAPDGSNILSLVKDKITLAIGGTVLGTLSAGTICMNIDKTNNMAYVLTLKDSGDWEVITSWTTGTTNTVAP